jgi:hypothetical protein
VAQLRLFQQELQAFGQLPWAVAGLYGSTQQAALAAGEASLELGARAW